MNKKPSNYEWCAGCERRIHTSLFKASRCLNCHKDSKKKLAKKTKTEQYFTEEEYEAMGELSDVQ